MDCPGEYLKRERELRDVLLDDISKEIKVPIKLLRALEADDYQALPHATFVKGFIRAYCKYLGVDENDALLRYELYLQEIAEFEAPSKKINSLNVEERSYPVRKYLTLALVAAGIIIIAGVYYLNSNSDDGADTGKLLSVESAGEDAAPGVVKVSGEEVEVKPRRKVAKPALKRKELQSVKPESEEVLKVESFVKSPVVVEQVDEPPAKLSLSALKPEELARMELAPGEHLLRAYARELTWMKIEIDSRKPFEIMLQPGERAEWRGEVFFCS